MVRKYQYKFNLNGLSVPEKQKGALAMKVIRKIFATIISLFVDIIGGSILSYLADITFLNRIFYKKDKKEKK